METRYLCTAHAAIVYFIHRYIQKRRINTRLSIYYTHIYYTHRLYTYIIHIYYTHIVYTYIITDIVYTIARKRKVDYDYSSRF